MRETATLAPSQYLTTLQVGRRFGFHRDTIQKWIKYGVESPTGIIKLKARKMGWRWKTTPEWIEEFFAKFEGGQAPVEAETPAAAGRRAAKEQQKAREALKGKRK